MQIFVRVHIVRNRYPRDSDHGKLDKKGVSASLTLCPDPPVVVLYDPFCDGKAQIIVDYTRGHLSMPREMWGYSEIQHLHRPELRRVFGSKLCDHPDRERPHCPGGKVGRLSARYYPGCSITSWAADRGVFQVCRLQDLWMNDNDKE